MTGANEWDGAAYDAGAGFVTDHGASLVDLLDPTAGEHVLDLGCGTGHLTAEIADSVGSEGRVVGVDSAESMVAAARDAYPQETHPNLSFVCGDARALALGDAGELALGDADFAVAEGPGAFDAVFSNAALHWVPAADQDAVLDGVGEVLRPGGRVVAELGGRGNVDALVSAVLAELADRGFDVDHPWYFPTVGEYAARLESHGFEIRLARLFDRPTALDGGRDGLRNWLSVFGDSLFAGLSEGEREAVVSAVEDRLREDLWDPETETWTADYRRLRVVALLLGNGDSG